MRVYRPFWGSLVILSVAILSAYAMAADASLDRDVDARALKVVQQASAYLSQAKQIRFRAVTTYDVVQAFGQKLQFSALQDYAVRRPDRVLVTTRRDDGNQRRVWYDGRRVTLYDDQENVYGALAVPNTLDATLDFVEAQGIVRVPVSDLLYSDLSFLWTRAESGRVVGESLIDGVRCHHLAFRNAAIDWQLWIAKGSQPLFRKLLITYKNQVGQPQFAARLSGWDLTADLPDALFVFSPPADAQKVRFQSLPLPLRGEQEEVK